MSPALPLTAACRCVQVTLRITQPPLLTSACHCTGCQRMTGGPYSLTVTVPADGFEVTSGSPVLGGLHGADAHHYMCPHCMSWVFTRAPAMPTFVNVRASMLDDRAWFSPYAETFTSEGFPWAETGAVRSFATVPPIEDYAKIVDEYRASPANPFRLAV